jgi:glycosyltransferase involved in cell wall biosynthesis
LPEVGGDAALYIEPQDVRALAQQIGKVLRFNTLEYRTRQDLGLEQAKKFSWEKSAREVREVYEKVLAQNPR